jgi:NodT family efflux transporter outer membrane factor (OMF) lipoprotein
VCGCTSPGEYIRNGFKVGPNYAKPPAPVEQNWIDAADPRLESRTPANLEWWTVLNDPVLNNLVKRAYRENLTLRQAAYRVLQFQAQRAIAAGNLFPQTQTFNGSYTANAVSGATANSFAAIPAAGGAAGGIATSGFSRFFNQFQTGFNLAWELDFWGRLRRILESADASLDASIEDYDNALVTLIGNVASTYVNIRTFQTRIKLANDNLKLQSETFKIVEAQFKAGSKNKVDVDQALTNLATVEALIPQLEIQQRQAENLLCTLLGIPPQELASLIGTASIPQVAPELVVGIPAELLRRRPDVLSAERQAAAQSAQIGVAEALLYPIVTINGTLDWQAARFHDLFGGRALAGSIGPAFTWNILNYGRLINGVRVQDALFQELVTNYQSVVLRAQSEAENGIIAYLKGHQVVRSLAKGVVASAEGVEIGTIQYTEGKIQFITLANLQQQLVAQQDSLATAYGNLVQGLIQTYQALGGGWQIRLQDDGQTPVETVPAPKEVPDINPKNLPITNQPNGTGQKATLGPVAPAPAPAPATPPAPAPAPSAPAAGPTAAAPARQLPMVRIDVESVR